MPVRRSRVLQGRWLSTDQSDSLLLPGCHPLPRIWVEELAALSTSGNALVSCRLVLRRRGERAVWARIRAVSKDREQARIILRGEEFPPPEEIMTIDQSSDTSAAALTDLITSQRITAVIYVAAKLGIADVLADGPKTSPELARQTGAHERSVRRLLRGLITIGVCKQAAETNLR